MTHDPDFGDFVLMVQGVSRCWRDKGRAGVGARRAVPLHLLM